MKLKEIAAQTGVSPSAVSLVMHGRPGVGAAKREQIMRLLEERLPIRALTVMVQKEAAQRLCAPPGTRACGAALRKAMVWPARPSVQSTAMDPGSCNAGATSDTHCSSSTGW